MQAARGTPLTPDDPPVDADEAPPHDPRTGSGLRVGPRGLFVLVFLLGYSIDVLTKVLAVHYLDDRDDVPLVGDLLQLTLVRNPGAAFSTGTSFTAFFSILALAAIVVVLWLSRRLGSHGWAVAFGMLLAGVAGNFTDRVFREPGFFHGHVVDFLRLPNWPVFNVADICIDVAAVLIVIQAVRGVGLDGRRHADRESS